MFYYAITTPWIKTVRHRAFFITLSDIDPIFKLFHWHTLKEIRNRMIIKDTTKPQTRRYTTLWNINVRELACSVMGCGSFVERWTMNRQQMQFHIKPGY